MSNCQKDVKCQKVKHMDYGGASQKKINVMRFTDIDMNFDIKYEGHQNCLKNIFYAHFGAFWLPSKLTSISVNLIMSIYFFL